MKRETLVLELNKTAAVFRAELSAPAYEGYWEAFEHEADYEFMAACRRARAECEFMPTIRELRRFLPDRSGRAAVAATDRLLARLTAPVKPWPARIGPQDPTPVAELVGQYLDTKH